MANKLAYLLCGIFFGFTLSRSGASEYNYIHYLFTGEDLKLALLIATAIITAAIGMQVLKLLGNRDMRGGKIMIQRKPLNNYTAVGGSLFGIGWAISGACPGTVLAQLGEGKILGFCTMLGLLCGTFLYALMAEKNPEL